MGWLITTQSYLCSGFASHVSEQASLYEALREVGVFASYNAPTVIAVSQISATDATAIKMALESAYWRRGPRPMPTYDDVPANPDPRTSLEPEPWVIERIRGRRLQRIRERHLVLHPLCEHCKRVGRVTEAVEVDHIEALANGGLDVAENRQSLCHDCHEIKTREDMNYRPKFGGDVNGESLDPNHPWNAK